MILEESDVLIHLIGTQYAINRGQEPHPYLITTKLLFMENYFVYACPLPSRIASFYNILTPLTSITWMSIFIMLFSVSVGFVVVNQVYKLIPELGSNTWNW